MLIVGYCFGIRSERRLCEEVHLNLAYRFITTIVFLYVPSFFVGDVLLAVADATAAAEVEVGSRRDPGEQHGRPAEPNVMTRKGLALLPDLAGAFRLTCEPARPQDCVVEVGHLDQRSRVRLRIEDAAVFLARRLAINAH
jgi:hypothetical protein